MRKYAATAMVFFLLTGCSIFKIKPMQVEIDTIRGQLTVLKDKIRRTDLNESSYPFEKAEVRLKDAETLLDKHNIMEAGLAVNDSSKILKEIRKKMRKDVKDNFIKQREEAKKLNLKEILMRADACIEKIKEAETKTELTFDDDVNIIHQYNESRMIKNEIALSFDPGRYKMSDLKSDGRQKLDKTVREVLDLKNIYIRNHPNDKIKITIKTVGYSDKQIFNYDIEYLVKSCERRISQNEPKRRQELNQCLSELRSQSISNYIYDEISKHASNITVVKEQPIGKGEDEIPPGVTPSDSPDDPSRRVCIVYIFIFKM